MSKMISTNDLKEINDTTNGLESLVINKDYKPESTETTLEEKKDRHRKHK